MADGALYIKIINSVMDEVFQSYEDKLEDFDIYRNKTFRKQKLTFSYENDDFAEIDEYPINKEDVIDCLCRLIECCYDAWDEEGIYRELINDLNNRRHEIDNNYSYIEWEYIAPDESGDGEEHSFKYGSTKTTKKSKKVHQPKKLSDLFPNIDLQKTSGVFVDEGGTAFWVDYKKHKEFLGTDNDNLYFPKNVRAISSDFDDSYMDETNGEFGFDFYNIQFENCVITTNVECMEPMLVCLGISHFYVVDAETEEIVYATDEFDDFCPTMFPNDEFNEFCERLEEGNMPWQKD